MSKVISVRVWQLLAGIVAITISITVYAYTNDNAYLKSDIDNNKKDIELIKGSYASKGFVKEQINQHEKVDQQRYIRIDENIQEIKESQKELKKSQNKQNELLIQFINSHK